MDLRELVEMLGTTLSDRWLLLLVGACQGLVQDLRCIYGVCVNVGHKRRGAPLSGLQDNPEGLACNGQRCGLTGPERFESVPSGILGSVQHKHPAQMSQCLGVVKRPQVLAHLPGPKMRCQPMHNAKLAACAATRALPPQQRTLRAVLALGKPQIQGGTAINPPS